LRKWAGSDLRQLLGESRAPAVPCSRRETVESSLRRNSEPFVQIEDRERSHDGGDTLKQCPDPREDEKYVDLLDELVFQVGTLPIKVGTLPRGCS
jgi:hypothetical protein